MTDADALPDHIPTLKAVIARQQREIADFQLWVAKLRRQQFGRRSERAGTLLNQLELQLEELETGVAEFDARIEPVTPRPATASAPASRALPAHLPRDVHRHHSETTVCPDCGGPLKPLGEDVSERLEYVPSHFRVIRHIRPEQACGRCDRIVQALAPSRPIARGLAGPGLLAHVLVSKYADHLPLYRQSEIHARAGVDPPRSTLAGWVGETAALPRPPVDAVRRHVLSGHTVHADDTPVPVLAPGRGSTKSGRPWAYVRDGRPSADPTPPAVWFAYSPDRQGRHPREHPRGFRGALHADGYAGFNGLHEAVGS